MALPIVGVMAQTHNGMKTVHGRPMTSHNAPLTVDRIVGKVVAVVKPTSAAQTMIQSVDAQRRVSELRRMIGDERLRFG